MKPFVGAVELFEIRGFGRKPGHRVSDSSLIGVTVVLLAARAQGGAQRVKACWPARGKAARRVAAASGMECLLVATPILDECGQARPPGGARAAQRARAAPFEGNHHVASSP